MPAKPTRGRGASKASGAGEPRATRGPRAGRRPRGRRRPLARRLATLASLEERVRSSSTRALPGRVAFSSSLGLEDQAILHAVATSGADVDVFTLDTGRHFPETLETLEASERRYRLRIRVVVPDAREVEELVARDGILDSARRREPQVLLRGTQGATIEARARGAAGWVTGLRRDQSAERAAVPFATWDAEHSLVKVNPIADWTLEQLEAYIAENDVPVNPLHAKGFPSIGCQPCTRAIKSGEDIRAGRWWWENEDGKECGLHNRPGQKEAAA